MRATCDFFAACVVGNAVATLPRDRLPGPPSWSDGQIGGIVRVIEDGRDCSAVVTQLAAASRALSKAGFAVVFTGMRYCSINQDGESSEANLRELKRLFLSLA